MSAESEEWEEVVAVDGNTYRVLKNPPPPLPRLPITDVEKAAIDDAIDRMAFLAKRRGVTTDSPRKVNENEDLCERIDSLIAETLVNLSGKVKDPAEKLFETLMDVSDKRSNPEEAWSLGIITIRFLDTMKYFVSFKKRFRGADRERVEFPRDVAHAELKKRGLTKK